MNTPQWQDETLHASVLHRDSYKCQKCRTKLKGHYVSKIDRNGPYEMSNLVTVCYSCNQIESVKDAIAMMLEADQNITETLLAQEDEAGRCRESL